MESGNRNEGNAGNQGGNAGNRGENARTKGGNAGNRGGNMGNVENGIRVGMRGLWGISVGIR